MTSESSTLYLQMATEESILELAEASHLSLDQLQASLINPKSPLHPVLQTLIKLRKCENKFSVIHQLIEERRTKLNAKKIKMLQEQATYNELAATLKSEYDRQFKEIEIALEALDDLEKKYGILENALKVTNHQLKQGLREINESFDDMRGQMRQAFLDGGMSRFDEKNVDDTLNYALNLTEKVYHV